MKKNILKGFLTLAIVLVGFTSAFADGFPPPPPGGHQQNGPVEPGGAAPLGSGLVMLLTMAIGYGSKKVFDARKKLAE